MDLDAFRVELDTIHQRVTTLHNQVACMPECCPTVKQTLAELSADLERLGTVEEELAARQLELLAARQAEEELKLYRLMVESVTE